MDPTLRTAATGMMAQQLRSEVIANNLANVNTTAFKGSRAHFEDLLYQTVQTAAVVAGPDANPRGEGTILLAEDDEAVRAIARETLERAGYRVLSAADGSAALSLASAHDGTIDLLLTDVIMPGMHGPELAARLAASRPHLPVVFVSGYSDEMPALPVVSSRAAFVAKPFTPAALVRAIDTLLAPEHA